MTADCWRIEILQQSTASGIRLQASADSPVA
jgi:hypothetical protein